MGGHREHSSPSLGQNRTAPGLPGLTAGEGEGGTLRGPPALRGTLRHAGVPRRAGIPREVLSCTMCQQCCRSRPCRGSWQTASAGTFARLPNPVPGTSAVGARCPPWVLAAVWVPCLPPSLAAGFLAAFLALTCISERLPSPQGSSGTRGFCMLKPPRTMAPKLPSIGFPIRGARALPWGEWDTSALPLQAENPLASEQVHPLPRRRAATGFGWGREGMTLWEEEEGARWAARCRKMHHGVSQT